MDEITFSDFAASGYNYIPVIRQLPLEHSLNDLLRCFPESSVWQLETNGRSYVYFTLEDQHTVTTWDNTVITRCGQAVQSWADTPIWPFIEDLHAGFTVPPLHSLYADLPPFMGGMIGILPRLPDICKVAAWPDALWLVVKTLVIMDYHEKKLWLLAYEDPIHAHAWTMLNHKLDSLSTRLTQIPPETALMRAHAQKAKATLAHQVECNSLEPIANTLQQSMADTYMTMAYTSQVNSEPHYKPEPADFLAYQGYGRVAFWLQQAAFNLLGASDRIHLTLDNRTVFVRLASPVTAIDDALASLLWDSLRNDISKVALPGSMRLVDDTAADGQHHWYKQSLQAQISGDTSVFDVIRASYPNSAYLGVPKTDALALLAKQASVEPQPLGCQIAMIGWDHSCLSWVTQVAKHWQSTSEIHMDNGIVHEEIGTPVIADNATVRAGEKA